MKSKVKPIGTSNENLQPDGFTITTDHESITEEISPLRLLAEVATNNDPDTACKTYQSHISPELKEILKLPQAASQKLTRKSTVDELPDHLASPECIRTLENKNLDKICKLAVKEEKAKEACLKSSHQAKMQRT